MAAPLIGKTRSFRLINAALLVLAGGLIVAGACRFAPGDPEIDTATLWMDTVQRGDLQIERRGAGQLFRSESGEMFAQVRIPESQSLNLALGQTAIVDLHIAEAPARVVELGDEIVQGTRIVRLEFTESISEAALPGMSIDAAIQVDVIADTLFVGKPAYGRAGARLGLFKVVDGGYAERVEVETGRASINLIEITGGLEEGDRIILSDMSRWDATSRVALR
jgi:multidrug efflux pump subunit AcrA (membrane-fusion protein)